MVPGPPPGPDEALPGRDQVMKTFRRNSSGWTSRPLTWFVTSSAWVALILVILSPRTTALARPSFLPTQIMKTVCSRDRSGRLRTR